MGDRDALARREALQQRAGIIAYEGIVGSSGQLPFSFAFANADNRGGVLTAFVTLTE